MPRPFEIPSTAVIETAVTDGVDAVKDDLIDVSKDLADAQAELLKAQVRCNLCFLIHLKTLPD